MECEENGDQVGVRGTVEVEGGETECDGELKESAGKV
jgi:hypothetical protein